ncbi:hypothetical protein [Agrobacterium tumefaciens]|uniref:hypothetical protein n=1 Tax=Agrobacterium tumefaciens TaxID=358 RepID=UPI002243F87F|nr:hypothetical protein [Agrobacterium tumefaciens]MCW8060645.1 hypothetical protein [Agrobacterium tumefaciens]
MKITAKETNEEGPSLIKYYRPLRLKAVVAATTIKGTLPEDKDPQNRCNFEGAADGYLDIRFSD